MVRQLELWGEEGSDTPADTRTLDEQALDLQQGVHAILKSTKVPIGLREIQRNFQLPPTPEDPLQNPVNRILKWMRDAGEIDVIEPEFGEPSFTPRIYPLTEPPAAPTDPDDSARDPAEQGVESLAKSPAPPLVRPDRQVTFDGKPHYEWPKPAHDRDTISVDRISDDIDGPAHRFFIHRYDYVEVFFSSTKVDYGHVVGISQARQEVGVSFQDPPTHESMIWFHVGCIYPTVEPEDQAPAEAVPLSQVIDLANRENEPEDGFTEADQVPSFEPYSFADFRSYFERLQQGSVTLAEHKRELSRLMASKEAFIAALMKERKAPQLKALAARLGNWTASRNTKKENATAVYCSVLRRFPLGDSFAYQPMNETLEQAVLRQVHELTDEQWTEHWQAKADEQKQLEASLENPQTIEDFRYLMREKGSDALSEEQRVRFDELLADQSREQRAARKASETVTQIESDEIASMELTLKQGWHDKNECDLWIVQLPERVSREAYRELLIKAKMLGGWYSSFKKEDAGFQFMQRDQADRFLELQQGSVDRSDVLEDRKARKMQSASERLASVAQSMEEQAEETLSADATKLKNTVRRAEQAAGMRGVAYAQRAAAETLKRIATELDTGQAKYLDGLRANTQYETLRSVLRQAQLRRNTELLRKRGELSPYEDYTAREELYHRAAETADVAFSEYPYPSIYKRHLEELLATAQNQTGLKQRSKRMSRYLAALGDKHYVEFVDERDIDELQTYLQACRGRELETTWVERGLEEFKRLRAANIHTPQELRCALRELLPHLQKQQQDDPIETLKRELIGKKIPGFFPTPWPVIEQMMELADIQPGHRVLEPSAGIGDILDAIEEQGDEIEISAIELNNLLHEILAAKGHEVQQGDFLEHTGQYDRIVMNPPFENGQDIDHVRHAYDQLAPGGRLVAVMSEGPFFRQDKKATEFREWFEEIGGESRQLPDDAFRGVEAFRETGVRTRLVTLEFWDEEGEPIDPAGQSTVNDATREIHQTAETLVRNESEYTSLKRVSLLRDGSMEGRPKLVSTSEAKAFFAKYWNDNPASDQEKFVVANLDTKHRVQSVVVVTVGTLDASLVHPREVFKPAILEGSSAIIVSHNHPSGDATPSREDHAVTEQLTEAGKLLGITLLDHIVYGDGSNEAVSIRES